MKELSNRRARTRQAMVDAGRALIGEKGVDGLRIQEITERAGVALGSFYNHFADKDDLVDAVVSESISGLADALATKSDADQDSAELVAIAIRRFISLAYADPEFAHLVVRLNHADALLMSATHPAAQRAVEDGLAAGRFDVPDLDVAVIAILGGSLAIMRAILAGRLQPGAEDAYAEACLRALGLPDDEATQIAARPLPALSSPPARAGT